jgi:hypothetical protein
MPRRAVWIQENTSRSHATIAFAGFHRRCPRRLALFQGRGGGMILSRWRLVLTLTPHLHPLLFVRGEAIRPAVRRRACPTTRFDRVLVASHQLPLRRALPIRFPVFLIPSASLHVSAIARSQACRLEFRRRICAQYLPATGCSRAMPDSSAQNQRAFQNRDSSGA